MSFWKRLQLTKFTSPGSIWSRSARDREIQFEASSSLYSGQTGLVDPVLKTAADIDSGDSESEVSPSQEPAHTGAELQRDIDEALVNLNKRREKDERR
jgi:hypothetical protein